MPDESLALSILPSPPPAERDYDAIHTTVMESARGRWFLDEFARRNRHADTRQVLAAIDRIETVVRDSREREAYNSFRSELLGMARTIAQTRAEVAENKPEPPPPRKAAAADTEVAADGADVFAAAERIQDVVWTMRERGFDPGTCEQIETLASTILSASALRDPNDHRTRKLGEVLQYLERRIDTMLDACVQAAETAAEHPVTDEPAAALEVATFAEDHAGSADATDAPAFAAEASESEVEPALRAADAASGALHDSPAAGDAETTTDASTAEMAVAPFAQEPAESASATAAPVVAGEASDAEIAQTIGGSDDTRDTPHESFTVAITETANDTRAATQQH
jgi:chemotaxis protein CheZ